jgi:hypothetical protein
MSSQEYIRSITEIVPDDFPTLTPLSDGQSKSASSWFPNFSWQTWIIIILILAFLGINVFAYLAKGTQETVSIFEQIFGPILKLFGLTALTTTKQAIETTATGAKAGIDIVEDTAIGAIDTITPGQTASSSLPSQEAGSNSQKWKQDSLEKALNNSNQNLEVMPDDSRSSIQTTGKSGWCYIGEEQGVRVCSEVGVNDTCMSGDVFPSQAICMNPKLRT